MRQDKGRSIGLAIKLTDIKQQFESLPKNDPVHFGQPVTTEQAPDVAAAPSNTQNDEEHDRWYVREQKAAMHGDQLPAREVTQFSVRLSFSILQ